MAGSPALVHDPRAYPVAVDSPRRSISCPDPVRRAVMRQDWLDLAYLHWRVEPGSVQRLLPAGLEVDTFDGAAWVGLIPFSMRGIGLARGPAVPYFGSFSEVNVRTYVRAGSIPGVWFFSLDVDRLAPALVARATYRLPYCWGATSHSRDADTVTTSVHRRWPDRVGISRVTVEAGDAIEADDLDVFLTARWGLYSRTRSGLRYAPVDHEPWPLRSAVAHEWDDTLIRAAGLPAVSGDPHVRFSDGVSVRIGLPRAVRRS